MPGAKAKYSSGRTCFAQSHKVARIGTGQGLADLAEVAQAGQPPAATEVVDLARSESSAPGQFKLRDTGLAETVIETRCKRFRVTERHETSSSDSVFEVSVAANGRRCG